MKLDLVKQQAATNSKVENVDDKVNKIVDFLREKVTPFIREMRDFKTEQENSSELLNQVLQSLNKIQDRLDNIEHQKEKSETKSPSSSSNPKLF